LLGDAAHAIVPFYGQGLNAGFEDVRMFMSFVDQHKLTTQSSLDDWTSTLAAFGHLRKTDGDAIAQLALDNFVEMRDKVADPRFVFQKKLEARLHRMHPDRWIPLYSQVTFEPQTPYHVAYQNGQLQQQFMDRILDRIPPEKQNDDPWIDALLSEEIQHL
jgi:kynurenine 3-monooxygenase